MQNCTGVEELKAFIMYIKDNIIVDSQHDPWGSDSQMQPLLVS
jgi:hypothetical protein